MLWVIDGREHLWPGSGYTKDSHLPVPEPSGSHSVPLLPPDQTGSNPSRSEGDKIPPFLISFLERGGGLQKCGVFLLLNCMLQSSGVKMFYLTCLLNFLVYLYLWCVGKVDAHICVGLCVCVPMNARDPHQVSSSVFFHLSFQDRVSHCTEAHQSG